MHYDETEIEVRAWPAASEVMSARLARNWWAIALRGVFAILFGLAALLMPVATLAALALLFAAYMAADGILAIIAALRAARRHERWGWLVFEGIADLIAGAVAFFWPLLTVLAFVLLMGAWAIVSGALLTAAAFRLHAVHGRWLMLLGGAISLLWGVLVILWPLAGAVALTWWMAAYALLFGIALLVLAFRLRRQWRNLAAPWGWRSRGDDRRDSGRRRAGRERPITCQL